MKQFFSRIGRISPTSSTFPLIGGLLLIMALGLGLVIGEGYGEIQGLYEHFLQLPNPSEHYFVFSMARQRFVGISVLAIAITSVLIIVLVQQALAPLQRRVQRTQAIQEQQRQLINDLSHELRSPLSMVYSYLQRMQKQSQGLSESQQEALGMAVADAERMNQLLQGWLNLARSEQQEIIPLILNEILLEVAQMLEKLENRRITLNIPAFPVQVQGDRSQLMQVFNHLLDNAVYYSTQPVTVTLNVSRRWATVEVIDRGCGISPSDQGKIFDPLYRVDSSRSRTTGGFGLGLPFVKRSVESMGGQVKLKSQVGVGSRFIVILPLLGVRS